ncbi:uncharacterized protein AMSG_02484 [Thecamonas trahens ATCC 50062]|uniref:Uncharacterized protein n=1 Tax=Thecamonas trahens ATCC 50062 TaxID=461836 RepID=A0A0L0D522_THETB|nr:hypothetical protein AMSG_02484 [Thecamonas trahens ATCC 50062]KNC47467.1 hypothetical protein AMSG_02484 [Thecamonas trahens ATCC 50062]|eukprot:XP_013759403.1 hypothetical protein AMSG_02484 [Thecamonas trahens ATCC 50062]
MSLEALKDALRSSLEASGALEEARAGMRAQVYEALVGGEGGDGGAGGAGAVPVSQANLILNELIAEYLAYNGYHHTLSVFAPESALPHDRIAPQVLRSQLRLPLAHPEAANLPILYQALAGMQDSVRSRPPVSAAEPTRAPAYDMTDNAFEQESDDDDNDASGNHAGYAHAPGGLAFDM